jgi:hypothetical protein
MFPMTMTLHSPAQLNAVLRALQPRLADAPEPSPEGLVSYLEADAGVTAEEKAALAKGWPHTFEEAEANQAAAKAIKQAPGKSTAQTAPVTYDQVAAAITAAVKVNREKAIDALAKFGARKGPELKPEQYRDFLAALA